MCPKLLGCYQLPCTPIVVLTGTRIWEGGVNGLIPINVIQKNKKDFLDTKYDQDTLDVEIRFPFVCESYLLVTRNQLIQVEILLKERAFGRKA